MVVTGSRATRLPRELRSGTTLARACRVNSRGQHHHAIDFPGDQLYGNKGVLRRSSALTGLVGSHVTVTLEVHAEVQQGVPEKVVRTVTENCRTLKFQDHGFEES
jgi:hypothetical protein